MREILKKSRFFYHNLNLLVYNTDYYFLLRLFLFFNTERKSIYMKKSTLIALTALSLSLAACGGESAQQNTPKPATSSPAPQAQETKPAEPNPEQAKKEVHALLNWYEGTLKKMAEMTEEMAKKTQEIQAADPNNPETKAKIAAMVKEHSEKNIAQNQAFLKDLEAISVQQAEAQELKTAFHKNYTQQIEILGLTLKALDGTTPNADFQKELETKTKVAIDEAQKLHTLLQTLQQKYPK